MLVVQDAHNNNHDNAPQQLVIKMPGVEMMNRTTIKQFQKLKPSTFHGTLDPMARVLAIGYRGGVQSLTVY